MKRNILIVLTIIWMVIIFSFSAAPADESSEMSLWVGHTVGELLVPEYGQWSEEKRDVFAEKIEYPIRKCAHATEYAVLGVLLISTSGTFEMEKRRMVGTAIAIGVLYAASDEFHQLFVPGRSGRVTDVIIDSVGLAVGIILTNSIR